MKRVQVWLVSALLVVVLSLSCGCRDGVSPSGDKQLPDKQTKTISLYICGAVEHPGFYDVPEGTDVQTAVLEYARICDNGVLPADGLRFASDGDVIAVNFVVDKKSYSAVNVNGMYVTARLGAEGVADEVVNRLADYIEQHGAIRNYAELTEALGNFYKDNYYKFFVSKEDYREVD